MSQTFSQAFKAMLNMPKINQDSYFRHLARLEAPERIAVMQKHRSWIHKLKYSDLDHPIEEISYGALIIAIEEYKQECSKISRNNFEDLSLEKIGEVTELAAKIQMAKHKRPSPKTEAVLKYWGTVLHLQNKGYGLQTICHLLEDKYDVKVSKAQLSRISTMMKTFQNVNQKAGEMK